jgi:pyridoxal phosphate-dependent aminotransferase EpsN
MPAGVTERPNCWLSVALLPDELDPVRTCVQLTSRGIEARQAFKPMHAQPVFAGSELIGGEIADRLFARGICLPSGSGLSPEDQAQVIGELRSVLRGDASTGAGRDAEHELVR